MVAKITDIHPVPDHVFIIKILTLLNTRTMFYPNLTCGCTFGTSETDFGYGFDRLLGLMTLQRLPVCSA